MARGRRKQLTLEEQLKEINLKIQQYESDLQELKNQKDKIESTIKEKQINDLYEIIKASGKSIDDIKNMLAS